MRGIEHVRCLLLSRFVTFILRLIVKRGDMSDDTDAGDEQKRPTSVPGTKQVVPGLIYISFVPPNMTPFHIRQMFEKYGEVGRIFLQPDDHNPSKKKKKFKAKYNKGSFAEGWIEMGDKRIAKRLALTLNNTLIVDGKKSKFSDYLWNVKYLHRFQWRHLTERLAHEMETKKQRSRMEQTQAKKETAAFVANVEASKRLASIRQRKEKKGEVWQESKHLQHVRQRKTVEELRRERQQKLQLLNKGEHTSNKRNGDGLKTNSDFPTKRKAVLNKIFS